MIAGGGENECVDDRYEWCSNRLVEILRPHGDGFIVSIVEAYCDESERPDGEFCVAGLVLAPVQAKKLAKEWHRVLEGRPFHASDFFHGRKAFADTSQAQRDQMIKKLVKLAHKRISFAVAVGCNLNEVTQLVER